MDFGEVLSRAWKIVWRYKVLWIFGILAGCGQSAPSAGSNTNYRFQQSNGTVPPQIQRLLDRLGQVEPWQIFLFAAIVFLVLLLLFIIGVVLNTFGRVGLIRGTQLAEGNPERLEFSELLNAGAHFFWRVFFVNLLFGIIILLAFLVLGLPLIICTLGIGAFCLIPIMWFFQLVLEQINIAVVVEDLGIGAAIERGWEVVTRNLGSMIVMALILFIGSLIAGIVIGLPLLLIFGPAIIGYLVGTTQNLEFALPGGLIAAGLCLLAYLPVLLVLGGIIRAFTASAWTLTFMRLTHPAAPAAVVQAYPTPE